MTDIGSHKANFPWSIDPKSPGRILDSKGIPVAFGSSTTSVRSRHKSDDGLREEVSYRTTDTAASVRARIIVDAVNASNQKEITNG